MTRPGVFFFETYFEVDGKFWLGNMFLTRNFKITAASICIDSLRTAGLYIAILLASKTFHFPDIYNRD